MNIKPGFLFEFVAVAIVSGGLAAGCQLPPEAELQLSEDELVECLGALEPDQRTRVIEQVGACQVDEAPEQRPGLIFRKTEALTLLGPSLRLGDRAPAFELVGTEGAVAGSAVPRRVSSAEFTGRVVVLSVVPSIDTPVCEQQTERMNQLLPGLPAGTVLITVSRDLPFAQRRFKQTRDMRILFASDFNDAAFGRSWGILVEETGLLARSVWVIDRSGNIAYSEIVRDQTSEPDYQQVELAVAALDM